MKLGLSLGFTATQGAVGEPHIITATITPTVQAVTDGDTWADLLLASATNTANYASTAGNITTAVAEVNVDGGGWTALAGNEATALSYDESVQVRVTVSDDAGSDPRVWNAGTVSVAGIAPAITASDGLAGRTLTITVDSLTGNPAPSVALTTLTLDGADVPGDATGSGPWSYVVPDSSSAQTVAWEVTATNSEGSDTASGSEVVAANIVAPTFAVPNQSVVTGVGPFTLDLATFMTDNGGDAFITYGLTPQAGVSLAGSVLTFTDSVGTYSGVAVSATNAGGTTNDTFNFEVTSAATAPAQFGAGDWSVASGDTQATVTITALPSNGGAAITAIEYQLDGGAWQDSGRTTTGAFTITGLTNLTEYQVALRAVNAVGNGTASATKAVTPAEGTLALNYDPDGTPVVGLVDGSDVTVTIDGTPYVIAVADLSDDFHMLGTSTVTGTDGVGNTWTAVEGLHVFSDGAEPVITYEWRDGDDNPLGVSTKTYVQQADDATDGLKVVITFSNGSPLTVVHSDTVEAIAKPVPAGAVVSGYTGTMVETEDATYYYKTLTTDGTISFLAGGEVDIEFISGGGGGGYRTGGGGGAGGYLLVTGETVSATTYPIEIGAGGVGSTTTTNDAESKGGTTTGFGQTIEGGGAGSSSNVAGGLDGACGGGTRFGISSAGVGTGSLGFDGGYDASVDNGGGGGGGGMGGVGGNNPNENTTALGGAGVTDVFGETVCAGGKALHKLATENAVAATVAGNGGEGGSYQVGYRDGSDGAPGRVVIRIAK